ncbi:hypothetical protein J3F83DRAFT_534325 [Trichoderma novae-zelandiae]
MNGRMSGLDYLAAAVSSEGLECPIKTCGLAPEALVNSTFPGIRSRYLVLDSCWRRTCRCSTYHLLFPSSSRLTGVNLNYIISTRVLSLLLDLASLVTIACLRDNKRKMKKKKEPYSTCMGLLDRRGVI